MQIFLSIFKNKNLQIKSNYNFHNIICVITLIIVSILFYLSNNVDSKFSLNKKYKIFIKDCNNLKLYNNSKIVKANQLYFSICIPAYNVENYIARTLLSIINQSFQKFEVVVVNDNSNDKTLDIIKNYSLIDERIKIINHFKNLGVYKSRIDGILKAKGKYILLVDPDDLIINPSLFEYLFNYNQVYNLDIIEFSVYDKKEWLHKIYFPKLKSHNHYHIYSSNIIYQPQLSNIIFHDSNSDNYSPIQCRTIWNKIVRKNIILKAIYYIEKSFHNKYLISSDDTPINILNFQFSNNYTNIFLPGYLYFLRNNSASRLGNNIKKNIIICYNYLLYYMFLYKYIKDFNKDDKILLFELEANGRYVINLKQFKLHYKGQAIYFFNEILKDEISTELRETINNIINIMIN